MTLIEGRNIAAKEKIHYLQRYLKGEAKEAIEGLFYFDTDEAYQSAWEQLDKRYGNPFMISEAFRRKLYQWPEIQANDSRALRKFSDFLQQCMVAKSQVSSLAILDDCYENRRLLVKLPRWIQTEWSRKVSEKDCANYPSFEEFCAFISRTADRVNNPIFLDLSEKPKRTNNSRSLNTKTDAGSNQVANTGLKTSQTSDKSQCVYCKVDNQTTNNCRKFRALTPTERSDFVKKNTLKHY
jgi:hypothetical protein